MCKKNVRKRDQISLKAVFYLFIIYFFGCVGWKYKRDCVFLHLIRLLEQHLAHFSFAARKNCAVVKHFDGEGNYLNLVAILSNCNQKKVKAN
jgi:hypothetical protein